MSKGEAMEKKVAIIAGAGVAGLTAAKELLDQTDVKPVIYEMTDALGGISKTINYKGNHMDIGGHRFFSKSDRVMNWWQEIMPLIEEDQENGEDIMIVRHRISRIFYMMKFFDYPIKLNGKTLKNLGLVKVTKIGVSYIRSTLFPIKEEKSLEDFFINRFGRELYKTFFKDYTEKVWGVPCSQIKPEWGAQRIKGISIRAVLAHGLKNLMKTSGKKDIGQKDVETSLINQFLYPKYGVGQMWDQVGRKIQEQGTEIHFNKKVRQVFLEGNKITKVVVEDQLTKMTEEIACDYFISTMPVRALINGISPKPSKEVLQVASELKYRDFISVGLLLKSFNLGNNASNSQDYKIPDNWIYVQENSVKMGRIQIFNNWSPYMVSNPDHYFIGLEYFSNEGDEFWSMEDDLIKDFAIEELIRIQAIEAEDVVDGTVVRMPKAYPSYFGGYETFDTVRSYVDKIENLFLIGRNGMHRYNNMDHSMLTAIKAVENIKNGDLSKENIWTVNAEKEYHEEKKE